MAREVTVVLITWNSAGWLPRCLDALAAQSIAGGGIRLVVVDNGSTDDSVSLVERARPVHIIRNRENRGFAAAVNQGITASSGDWVVLLNPDLRLGSGYIDHCVTALERAGKEFGAATGTLYRAVGFEMAPTAELDSRGIRMTRTGRHLDITDPLPPHASGPQEVFGVSGAAAVFRRACLEDVAVDGQVFDEDFFTYREDADLAWRARIFGWRSLHVPDAIGWHVRTVTPEVRRALPPEVNFHSVKNRFLLRLKNEGTGLLLRNGPFEISRDLVVIGAALTIERSSLPALRWLWQHRRAILRKRAAVQSRRRVSDRRIARWFR